MTSTPPLSVYLVRDGFQMIRVYAAPDAAKVVKVHSFGDRAFGYLV